MNTTTYKVSAGQNIYDACEKALNMSVVEDRYVEFKFNDIDLVASPNSSVEEIAAYYNRTIGLKHAERSRKTESIDHEHQLLDQFAGQAMVVLAIREYNSHEIPTLAYNMAESMMKERASRFPKGEPYDH